MRQELIAVRGKDKLFYTHDITNEVGIIVKMGYVTKGDSDLKMEVNINQILSRGYWEEPQQPVKQLGEPLVEQDAKSDKKEKNTKKQKVRIAVPAGSKGAFSDKKLPASNLVLPPGKMKFTGVGEDGVPEAEITEQVSAEEYMKKIEKISLDVVSSSQKPSIQKRAKERADKINKLRKEMTAKSGTPQSMSGI